MRRTDSAVVVLHSVSRWLPRTQTWLHSQVRHLPPDVTSHILCDQTENLDAFGLPNIHCLSNPQLRYLTGRALRKFGLSDTPLRVAEAGRFGASILHSHFGDQGWHDLEIAQCWGFKHVVTFYDHDISYLPSAKPEWVGRYRELFESVDRVLCEGPHMARCAVLAGCPEDRVRVHHLGVRTDDIPFRPRTWDCNGPLRVLIAAAFREKKGIPYAIDALGRIAGEVPLEVTIIGGPLGSDERSLSETSAIESAIERNHLSGSIRMLGFQPVDVLFDEAYRHHVYLSPSVTAKDGDTEGGAPVAIIEMVASGMPVVSSRHCDIPEVIQDGVGGLLADERDIDGLAKHLMWLVRNPNEWQSLTAAGREHINLHYNVRIQGVRLAGVYGELGSREQGTGNRRDRLQQSLRIKMRAGPRMLM